MNFVKDLEECLRDLASASRSRHPGVKEASERAVLKLRALQAGYVAQVRQCAKATSASASASASTTSDDTTQQQQHPTTAIFRSSDLLHPFLLAANYPNADFKLLEISFRAMRLLMEADAIVPSAIRASRGSGSAFVACVIGGVVALFILIAAFIYSLRDFHG